MSERPDPDWLHPGAELALVAEATHGGGGRVETVVVDRVLKRDVVLDNGRRVRRDRLSWSTGTWDPTTYLVPRDDPRVIRVRTANRIANSKNRVHRAYEDWRRDPSEVNTAALRGTLDAWDKVRPS